MVTPVFFFLSFTAFQKHSASKLDYWMNNECFCNTLKSTLQWKCSFSRTLVFICMNSISFKDALFWSVKVVQLMCNSALTNSTNKYLSYPSISSSVIQFMNKTNLVTSSNGIYDNKDFNSCNNQLESMCRCKNILALDQSRTRCKNLLLNSVVNDTPLNCSFTFAT